ncbi:MAG TPA: phosphoglycerate dehydrogenase [Methanosarcinales archaeon]|nr:phosphoglycerate dehydrogenase [Methanosarcinales archaeon]
MKVLVSDSLSEKGIEILEKGAEVDVRTGMSPEELKACIGEYDALVVRSQTQVTEEVIGAAENLKIIGRAGVGVDNIDVEAATQRGIIVINAPQGNMISAAEHTIAMMMAISRNIPQANQSMKAGKWDRKLFMGVEVRGKTLGVVGLGRIGAEVAKRAQGMEMNILAYDPFISEERAADLGVKLTTVEDIVLNANYITVHTPLTKDTRNLIDREEFEKARPGVRIINCARGGIINEKALAEAVASGKVAGAAIDVYTSEPPTDSPLLEQDNIILTPHLGASTKEAQVNVAVDVAEQIINFNQGLPVKNAINMPYVKQEIMNVLQPYLPLAEKIGKLAAQLMEEKYERIEVSYSGEIAEWDTGPVTVAALKGLLEFAMGSSVNYVNAPVIAKERKIKVVESKSKTTESYSNLIMLNIFNNGKVKTVGGTMVGTNPRIVQIDEFSIDVLPLGHMIIALHEDHPNIIGPCCIVLGNHDINIAGMQVGRIKAGGTAIMALNVDSEVNEEILNEIRAVKGILNAKMVYL